MRILIPVILLLVVLSACGHKTYHTVKVPKPRYHHSWYKDHKWHKKIQVGRFQIRLFEKQGVKTVRMKG